MRFSFLRDLWGIFTLLMLFVCDKIYVNFFDSFAAISISSKFTTKKLLRDHIILAFSPTEESPIISFLCSFTSGVVFILTTSLSGGHSIPDINSGGRTKQPILNETKPPISKMRQNRRFRKRDKTADFENETKSPILKWDKTADFKVGQDGRFCKRTNCHQNCFSDKNVLA